MNYQANYFLKNYKLAEQYKWYTEYDRNLSIFLAFERNTFQNLKLILLRSEAGHPLMESLLQYYIIPSKNCTSYYFKDCVTENIQFTLICC